jgi:penicillin-binding protein activator
MNFNKSTNLLSVLALLGFVGCQTPAKYVEPNSNDGIVSVGEINIQDWGMSAEKMINSLLSSGVLGDGHPQKVMTVSRVRNSTQQHIDTDLLTKKIRVALMKSGKVLTTTVVDGEDPASRDIREFRTDSEFNQTTLPKKAELIAPEFSLSGKIIQLDASAGKTKQSSFVFQLSLTQIKTGLAIWEDETEITKQGSKPSIGW